MDDPRTKVRSPPRIPRSHTRQSTALSKDPARLQQTRTPRPVTVVPHSKSRTAALTVLAPATMPALAPSLRVTLVVRIQTGGTGGDDGDRLGYDERKGNEQRWWWSAPRGVTVTTLLLPC